MKRSADEDSPNKSTDTTESRKRKLVTEETIESKTTISDMYRYQKMEDFETISTSEEVALDLSGAQWEKSWVASNEIPREFLIPSRIYLRCHSLTTVAHLLSKVRPQILPVNYQSIATLCKLIERDLLVLFIEHYMVSHILRPSFMLQSLPLSW
jgi:hypothetical protein